MMQFYDHKHRCRRLGAAGGWMPISFWQFFGRNNGFAENSNSSIWLKLNGCLITQKVAIAVQKHLNTS